MKPRVSICCRSGADEPGKLSRVNAVLQQQLHKLFPAGGDYPLAAGLIATRRDSLNEAGESCERPRIGIVVQGGKCMEVSGRQIHCCETACFVDDSGGYGFSHVTTVPYLSLSLGLDRHVLLRLMTEGRSPAHPGYFPPDDAVALADAGMVAAFSRFINLAGRPEQVRFLAPLIIKEIHYRALTGPLGGKIRALASGKTRNCSCNWARGSAFARLFRRR